MTEEMVDQWSSMVSQIAFSFARRYRMLDVNDIRQEIWMWFLTHESAYQKWEQLDKKEQSKLMNKSLSNAALKYCEKEKARVIGYDVKDVFYYDKTTVEIFLPTILSGEYVLPEHLGKDLNSGRSHKDPSEGNSWQAMRADISAGFDKLTDTHKRVLMLRFIDESRTFKQLGDELGCSEQAARKRTDRAIQALINKIGGDSPWANAY